MGSSLGDIRNSRKQRGTVLKTEALKDPEGRDLSSAPRMLAAPSPPPNRRLDQALHRTIQQLLTLGDSPSKQVGSSPITLYDIKAILGKFFPLLPRPCNWLFSDPFLNENDNQRGPYIRGRCSAWNDRAQYRKKGTQRNRNRKPNKILTQNNSNNNKPLSHKNNYTQD